MTDDDRQLDASAPRRGRQPQKRPLAVDAEPIIPTTNALFWAARYAGVRTANERLVLMVLGDGWSNVEHCNRRSHKTLATQACLSPSALKRALNGLRAQGTVDWRAMNLRGHKGRDGSPNCYFLPPFDSRAPVPPERFVLHESARRGRYAAAASPSSTRRAEAGPTRASGARKPKLRREQTQAESAGTYEVPTEVPLEAPHEVRTTSDGSRRPIRRTTRTEAEPSTRPSAVSRPDGVSAPLGDRDGKLNPAAERGDTANGCVQRLKIKLLAHSDDYVDPVNVKALTATLKRWESDGTEIEVIREMVDIFAAAPRRYMPKDDIPWRAFINARQKLQADAEKRLSARSQRPRRRLRDTLSAGPASTARPRLRQSTPEQSRGNGDMR